MSKPLTAELVKAKSKCDNLLMIKNLNLWGNDIDDVKLLRQMPNVEVLSLSVNHIKSLKEFGHCTKLQELYLRKNSIKDLSEITYLASLPSLRVLWLWDNPCAEVPYYRQYVIKVLPGLIKLDNTAITPEERLQAEQLDLNLPDDGKDEESSYDQKGGRDYSNNSPQVRRDVYEEEYQAPPPRNVNPYQEREIRQPPTPPQPQPVLNRPGSALAQPSRPIGGAPAYVKKESKEQVPLSDNPMVQNLSGMSAQRNDNVLCAVLALIKELDESSLELVKRDIDRKLGISCPPNVSHDDLA